MVDNGARAGRITRRLRTTASAALLALATTLLAPPLAGAQTAGGGSFFKDFRGEDLIAGADAAAERRLETRATEYLCLRRETNGDDFRFDDFQAWFQSLRLNADEARLLQLASTTSIAAIQFADLGAVRYELRLSARAADLLNEFAASAGRALDPRLARWRACMHLRTAIAYAVEGDEFAFRRAVSRFDRAVRPEIAPALWTDAADLAKAAADAGFESAGARIQTLWDEIETNRRASVHAPEAMVTLGDAAYRRGDDVTAERIYASAAGAARAARNPLVEMFAEASAVRVSARLYSAGRGAENLSERAERLTEARDAMRARTATTADEFDPTLLLGVQVRIASALMRSAIALEDFTRATKIMAEFGPELAESAGKAAPDQSMNAEVFELQGLMLDGFARMLPADLMLGNSSTLARFSEQTGEADLRNISALLQAETPLGRSLSRQLAEQHLKRVFDAGPPPLRWREDAFEITQLAFVDRAMIKLQSAAARRVAAGRPDAERLLDTASRELSGYLDNMYAEVDTAIRTIETAETSDRGAVQRALQAQAQRLQSGLKESAQARLDLGRRFPDVFAALDPDPLRMVDIQRILEPDEAYVLIFTVGEHLYVWAMSPDAEAAHRVQASADEIAELVRRLRASLDVIGRADAPPFNHVAAHTLYREIFAPIASIFEGRARLMVSVNGAMASVPLGVLLRAPTGALTEARQFRAAPWLMKTHAVSILPAPAALRVIRSPAWRASAARRPFFGVGDPTLTGPPGTARPAAIGGARIFDVAGDVDVDALRRLSPLPDTREELAVLADNFGASEIDLLWGDRANERALRRRNLADYRVLAFATHALVAASDLRYGEPAIVLTPPPAIAGVRQPREGDGALTATEIVDLRLDAELVVLSACNTAAEDGSPDGDGLAGLTAAFFAAGARNVIASHWDIESRSAAQLSPLQLIGFAEAGKTLAESHRIAALTLMNDATRSEYAHPAYWAPFVVIGDGGARRAR